MSEHLVLGATGFVGLNVVDALLASGVSVRAARRRRSNTIGLRRRRVEMREASLDDAASLVEAMRGCEVVHHAAGHYPRYSLDPEGALARARAEAENVLRACREAGVKRLVYTSSSALLEPSPRLRAADERDVGREMPRGSVYRAVKWAMESVLATGTDEGLELVSLLPSGCIGPGDTRLGTGGLFVAVVRRELPWYVDGHVQLVDVRDVARAHARAAEDDVAPGRYCLGGHGERLSLLLERVVERYGGAMPSRCLSASCARIFADEEEREAEPRRARVPFPRELVDIVTAGQPIASERARSALGFVPRPLEESLDDAHAWFRRHGYVPAR